MTIGDATMRLRNREVRHLCQCIDHAVSLYKDDLIQTEDVLETWEYDLFERKDFIGVCLLRVPLALWRLMYGFSQEFISPGDSDWHIFGPMQHVIRVGRGFSEHAELWPLSPQSVYSWDAMRMFDFVILVRQLSDFYLPIPYVKGDTSQREWIHSVGEVGIWTAERTKHWLLTKFIPKVLEHNEGRITDEVRSALRKEIIDLRLHRLSPAGTNDAEQLSGRVEVVQSWSYGSANLVRRELILPYYECLLTLATQSKRAKLDFAYVGSRLDATMQSLIQGSAASRQCQTLDDILDRLRFHVDRMRRETTEVNIRTDLMSRVFLAILEARPNLSQKVLNELQRRVELIWREARFERRHMGS